MDKLQPLLKNKFWIIAGLALLLPFVGWWMSTSAAAKVIEERRKVLDGLNVKTGEANQDYIDGIEKVNTVLTTRQQTLDERLYEKQKNLHTWPQYVSQFMDGKIFGDTIDDQTRRIYGRNYEKEVERMLLAAGQYKAEPIFDKTMNTYTGMKERGVIKIDYQADRAGTGVSSNVSGVIPDIKESNWKSTLPTEMEMWNTQEDVWLVQSILSAVKQVNDKAGATKISDAPIRQIFQIDLRGGSRPDPDAASLDSGSMGDGSIDDGAGDGGIFTNNYNTGRGEVDAAGTTSFAKDLTVDLDSVFGPETIQTTGTDDGSGNIEPMGVPMGNTGTGQAAGRRYVDDAEELPYKTRGFYIEVMMLHDKLPDLQAALVNMPWPTELLLVQQVALFDDELALATTGAEGGRGQGFRPGRGFGPQRPRGGAPGQGFGPRRFGAGGNEGGGFGGNRGAGGFRGFGGGNGADMENTDAANYQEGIGPSYLKAMEDVYMAKVGIAGLMTIYRSPEEMDRNQTEGVPAMETPVEPPPETTADPENPDGTTTTEDPEENTTTNETPEGTNPAEGTPTTPDPENPKPGAPMATDEKPEPKADSPETPSEDEATKTEEAGKSG